jgi:hypothetical protein
MQQQNKLNLLAIENSLIPADQQKLPAAIWAGHILHQPK